MFWYVGLIPDLATIRDRSRSRVRQVVYGLLALGWRGSADHWRHYETAVYLLAALSTPLVLSVHTVVSFDFAVSVIPGWHATVFPTLLRGRSHIFGLRHGVDADDPLPPAVRLAGSGHGAPPGHDESRDVGHQPDGGLRLRHRILHSLVQRQCVRAIRVHESSLGAVCLVLLDRWLPAMCWSPSCCGDAQLRVNPWALFAISILVNVGMWFERFVIIVTSLHRDYLPSSWGMFVPTWVDVIQFIGSFGLFFTLLLLFLRFLPMIAMFEVKAVLSDAERSRQRNGQEETHRQKPAQIQETQEVVGMLARFPSADTLSEAVTDLRQQGYRKLDAFSPFPIHGLSKKLGLGRSPLPPMVFVAGAFGLLLSLGGMLYLNVIEYPLITGGKPYAAVQPITPILFEVMILFAALATVGGLLKLTGLAFFRPSALEGGRFPQSNFRWLLSVRRRP